MFNNILLSKEKGETKKKICHMIGEPAPILTSQTTNPTLFSKSVCDWNE